MNRQPKEKKISIEISIKNFNRLELCFKEIIEVVANGNEVFEKDDIFYNFKVNMEYPEKPDYIEQKIDGKYYLIFKPVKK
jgi:hypothetical protein